MSTLTLSGTSDNSYTGLTTVTAGTLSVAKTNALGTSTLGQSTTIASGAMLSISGGITLPENIRIAGSGFTAGGVVVNESGVNTIGGTVTLTDDVEVQSNSGTLNFGAAFTQEYNLTFDGSGAIVVSGGLEIGAGNVTKQGAGMLTLSGASTYTGTTTIADLGGTIKISGTGSLGSGTPKTYANTISIGDSGTFLYASDTDQKLTGVISGAGELKKNTGSSTLTLTGANTFTGLTTVSTGIVDVQHNTALGDSGSSTSYTTVASGAAVTVSGGLTGVTEPLYLAGTGVSSNGALRNTSGSNTWSGAVTLTAAAEVQVDTGSTLTMSGGVSGTFGLTVESVGSSTISGAIATSTGSVTKTGAGTLTLSAANTYTGVTQISTGTVMLSGSGRLSDTTAVTVNTGATFDLN
ncbi:MAG: hypothetical protein EBV29_10950, partial [Gammaproteobacteria bacterium]|nr:hypothetical protein [Gammaproteobacteria bacterium]